MFKRVSVVFILSLLCALSSTLYAQEERTVSDSAALGKEVEYRLDTNRYFLGAAHTIVGKSSREEAERFMKMADSARAEALAHNRTGFYGRVIDDLAESTQMAIQAIILAEGTAPPGRKFIVEGEFSNYRLEERNRKVATINRRTIESQTFIRSAERMLGEGENRKARALLEDGKERLGLSRREIKEGRYDEALAAVNEAYTLVTGSVREISRARGGIISFPRPTVTSQEELFSYELKQNGTYLYLLSGVAQDGRGDVGRALKEGRAMRREAIQLMEAGKIEEALDMLQSSTKRLAEAANTAGKKPAR